MNSRPVRGRGAGTNPANRFALIHLEPGDEVPSERQVPTEYLRDSSRSVISSNNSPDVGFDYSLNPYRGCEHGCSYCYARPTHEYLGFSAGLDFETRILVKEDAPQLLEKELSSSKWQPSPLALSGVTDPYQPVERKLEITRRCLKVLSTFRNPVIVITKNHLVTRDIDHLGELAQHRAAVVTLSITTLEDRLQRSLEPRASSPRSRLAALQKVSRAGIPARVLVAPVIPGLNDHEVPSILKAASGAGATAAGYVLLRLPHGLKQLFQDWLEENVPERAGRVRSLLSETRGGRLYDSSFHQRMKGSGAYAQQIHSLFHATCRKLGLDQGPQMPSSAAFRVPGKKEQLGLF